MGNADGQAVQCALDDDLFADLDQQVLPDCDACRNQRVTLQGTSGGCVGATLCACAKQAYGATREQIDAHIKMWNAAEVPSHYLSASDPGGVPA